MIITKDSFLRWMGCAVLVYLVYSLCSFSVSAETSLTGSPGEIDSPARQLSGEEILRDFADVQDDARVQDAAGTTAVNHWYADGRFVNRWSNGKDSGEVTGTWRVEKDQRCVTIATGLPEREGQESCGPVFQRGSEYLSFNPDGSIHGIHSLSPLLQATTTPGR